MATLQIYPVAQKFRRNRSILQGFRDISIFMFCNFAKNLKIQNGYHFWRDKIFFKIGITTLQRYPVGQKISSKSLYLARFSRYKRKFRKFKMAAIFRREKFFENWEKYSAEISCGSKILSKLLYLARFLRYKHFCVLQFLRKFRKFKMAAILGETNFF